MSNVIGDILGGLIVVGIFLVGIAIYIVFYGLIIVGILWVVCMILGLPFPPHIPGVN